MKEPTHSCTRAVILDGRHQGKTRPIRPGQQVIEIKGETLTLSDQTGEQVQEIFRYEFQTVAATDPTLAGFAANPEAPSLVRLS